MDRSLCVYYLFGIPSSRSPFSARLLSTLNNQAQMEEHVCLVKVSIEIVEMTLSEDKIDI